MSWDQMPPKGPSWNQKNNPQNNMDEVFNNLQQYFQGKVPGGNIFYLGILAVILVWVISTSVFIVNPQEGAVIKRFGEMHRVVGPGPQLKLPIPIETYIKEPVTAIRRLEVGFRTIEVGPPARYRNVKKEALMLTGDENILDIQFIVQYKIRDLSDYVFNIAEPEQTIKHAAESAMRTIVGHTTVDDALTTGKQELEQKAKDLLQNIIDHYDSGIYIENVKLQDVHPPDQVKDAFKDVTNAKEDKEKAIRASEGYANNLIPKARGEAEQIRNEAHAYAKRVVLEATGEAKRFDALYSEYKQAKDITKERMRIETMERILPHVNKVIADPALGKNMLPFLPLHQETSATKATLTRN